MVGLPGLPNQNTATARRPPHVSANNFRAPIPALPSGGLLLFHRMLVVSAQPLPRRRSARDELPRHRPPSSRLGGGPRAGATAPGGAGACRPADRALEGLFARVP